MSDDIRFYSESVKVEDADGVRTIAFDRILPAKTDRRRDRSVLAAHGAFAGKWTHRDTLIELAKRGIRGAALDFSGHHDSTSACGLGRTSLAHYCADVNAVYEWHIAHDGYAPNLLGHSMGGIVVQLMAADRKGNNAPPAVILFASAPPAGISLPFSSSFASGLSFGSSSLKMGWKVLVGEIIEPTEEDLHAVAKLLDFDPGDVLKVKDLVSAESGRALHEIVFQEFHVRAADLSMPVLVVAPQDDKILEPSISEKLCEKHSASILRLPGCGHMAMFEPPWNDAVAKIASWVRKPEKNKVL